MQELKLKMNGNALCVMDNLTVHHSSIVKDIFDSNFCAFYLPPYSCAMNPIERLWALVKHKWRTMLLQRDIQGRLEEDQEEIIKCLD